MTDLTGTIVYDYWDLPVVNPEGIAINNKADPPKLYIATDPSAPSGPQYVPLILGFEKPQNGTGYVYWDHKHLPKYVTDPPPCRGCHKAFEGAYENGFEKAYYWENHFPEAESSGNNSTVLISVLVPISAVCLLLMCITLCAIGVVVRKKIKKQNKGPLEVASFEDLDEEQEYLTSLPGDEDSLLEE